MISRLYNQISTPSKDKIKFYNITLIWQWLRLPGDLVFSAGVFIMAFYFIRKIQQSRKNYGK